MLDDDKIDELIGVLIDRFTAEELCEILGLGPEDIIDRFYDEILRTDWNEYL